MTFVSGKVRGSSASFTFTVNDVIMSGYIFDDTMGETSGSITVPESP